MKHPFKFFALLILVSAALATAVVMTMRYMDVLQQQFDFLRGQLGRRKGPCDCDPDDEFDDDDDDDDDAEPFPSGDDFDGDDLKF